MLAPGATVASYVVEARIGGGGSAEIFVAHDRRLGRRVALKILKREHALSGSHLARLQSEAQKLAALNHPNIATLYAIEQFDDTQVLVLELIDGQTLRERLADGALSVQEALTIALQVAAALDVAHEHGIVHCDLKPENIKLREDGTVKVLDFDIARTVDDANRVSAPDDETVTVDSGSIMGTVAYMSPEQARGLQIDRRTDNWRFGCVLYEMLTGERAFPGGRADALAGVLTREPDYSRLPANVPPAIGKLLRHCLAKNTRERLRDIGDARLELREVLTGNASESHDLAPSRRWLRLALAGTGIVASLAVAAVIWPGWLSSTRTATRIVQFEIPSSPSARKPPGASVAISPDVARASIAVLPFVNMSGDAEQEYFSDGLSEELINQLAHIDGLRVTARGSAFEFKGRTQDVSSVGRSLGVAHILKGSIRKAGDRMRVTVQLISAANGYNLWSETYDRALGDVFAMQDEIAAAVAARLGPTVGIAPRSIDFGGTASLDAYDHLLRGDSQFARGPEGFSAAIEEYGKALAIDPGYARASAELAIAISSSNLRVTDDSGFARVRERATQRALASAPDMPLSLVAKMWLHADRREWVEGDAACQAAFAARQDPRAEWLCGGFLSVTGRVRTALPYREAARRADPLSMNVAGSLARQYAFLDMGPELRREFQRTDGLTGARWAAEEAMLAHLHHAGAPAGEIAALFDRACPNLKVPVCSVWAAAIRTPQQGSSILSAQLAALPGQGASEARTIALAAAAIGDTGLTLDALEVLSRSTNSAAFQSMWYPLLGEARRDPRFKRLVRDIGFEDLWRRTGRWGDYCRPVGSDDFECF
ncbi:MAG: protein kinase [Pseudomonadota bacterium]